MKLTKSLIAGLGALALTSALIGSALASAMNGKPATSVANEHAFGALQHVSDLEIFDRRAQDSTKGRDLAAVARLKADAVDDSIVSTIDLSSARSVPVPGTNLQLWLVQAAGDRLCVLTPA